jgi:hypothetical protein
VFAALAFASGLARDPCLRDGAKAEGQDPKIPAFVRGALRMFDRSKVKVLFTMVEVK